MQSLVTGGGILSAAQVESVTVERGVAACMRDGTWLVADVYRPVVNGAVWNRPLPVLLQRTPYDRSGVNYSEISVADPIPRRRSDVAERFAREGYVVVVQDCRGRHESGGTFVKYVNEAEDGFDTIGWIVGQDWCDGRVGTFGLSYEAHVQLAAACLGPAGLACMSIDSGGFWDAYQAGIRQGGCFELKQLTWAVRHVLDAPEVTRDPMRRTKLKRERIEDWIWRWPWSEGESPLAAAPQFESYILTQWRLGEDGPYWQRPSLCARRYVDQIPDIPTLLIGSWYDPYAGTMIDTFQGLRATKQSDVALIMGPWTHGRRSEPYAGDVSFGETATLDGSIARDYDALRLGWFGRWLKDGAAPKDEPKVRAFVMGGGSGKRDRDGRLDQGGRWIGATSWPPVRTVDRVLHLHRNGRLDEAAPLDEGKLQWRHDPDHPVPTIGGAVTSGEPLMDRGAFDQVTHAGILGAVEPYGPLADRADVLCFETAPLGAAAELVGNVTAKLFVSSDRPDTDLVVRLLDIHPPSDSFPTGFRLNLSHGVLRLRYRDSWTTPTPLRAGEIYEIDLELFPIANRFEAGHRIRIEICSSSFPHFDPNPGSFGRQGHPGPRFVANNVLHLSPTHASHVRLPIFGGDE